jgi:hypothetical protein
LQLMSALVSQKREIERQLASVKQDLLLKAEAERMLNESLKEALGLLRPLQMHLETAEKEKKVVSKQLKYFRILTVIDLLACGKTRPDYRSG